MKRYLYMILTTAALVAAILLLPRVAPRGVTPAAPHAQAEVAAATGLEGPYRGYMTLGAVVGGAYTDALATPKPPATGTPDPELGQVDFALYLHQGAGTAVDGYVDLETTLVFTRTGVTRLATPYAYPTGALTPAPVATVSEGPKVSGTFDGVNLALTSEPVELLTSTGLRWVRQFRLIGKRVSTAPDVFEGEYRETFTELDQPPITLVGTFLLSGVPPLVPRAEITATPGATGVPGGTPTATTSPPAGGKRVYLPMMHKP